MARADVDRGRDRTSPKRGHRVGACPWGKAIRTGLEDNIRIGKDRLANSNAELVKIAADICRRYDTRPVTPEEARALPALP
jgi:uncharacterized protein (DUF849 family)